MEDRAGEIGNLPPQQPQSSTRRELGWYDLDALERTLQRLSGVTSKLAHQAQGAVSTSQSYVGTKSFAPVVSAALAVEAMTVGLEAQIQHIANVLATSKRFLDPKLAPTSRLPQDPPTTPGDRDA